MPAKKISFQYLINNITVIEAIKMNPDKKVEKENILHILRLSI